MATIEIKGVDEIVAKFAGFGPKIMAAIKAIVMEIKGKISTYPEQVAGAIYRRTDHLMHAWGATYGNMSAVIGNNTEYGPVVQDREFQTYQHLFDGWRTVQDYAEEYQPIVTGFFHDVIEETLVK